MLVFPFKLRIGGNLRQKFLFIKLWFVISTVIIIGINPLQAQEDHPTAKENIDQINAAATALASDAKICAIDGGAVTPNGESHNWIYIYKSASKYRLYQFQYEDGELKTNSTISQWEDFHPHRRMTNVPDGWKDSDAALNIAEQNGGSDFRATYGSNVEVEMRLMPPAIGSGVGFFALYPYSVWTIRYRKEENAIHWVINAVNGEIYDYRNLTAKSLFDEVKTVALQGNSDAGLYRLRGHHIDIEGKSGEWEYIFQSIENNRTAAYRVMEGRIGFNLDHEDPPDHPFTNDIVIPDSWIDSDSAVQVAESMGGEAFRNSHAQWEIVADMAVRDMGYAQWELTYQSDPDADSYLVDAVEVISQLAGATAEAVLAAALNKASDAELVYIFSDNTGLDGKSPYWIFSFRSESLQDIIQFAVSNGNIIPLTGFHGPHDKNMLMAKIPILGSWMDSDSAVIIAEGKGGEAFRNQYSDWKIFLHLYVTGTGTIEWEVSYESSYHHESYLVPAGQVETILSKAGELFPKADSVARNMAEDARLVFLVSQGGSNEKGEASTWNYFFKSEANQKIYQVNSFQKSVYLSDSHTGYYSEEQMLTFEPIPKGWMDSDSALLFAENRGGRELRQENEDWTIRANLAYYNFSESTQWRIRYDPGKLIIFVSAFHLPYSTARENLAQVDSMANEKAADANLYFVLSENVDSTGRSDVWKYFYDAVEQGYVFELWSVGNKIVEPPYPHLPNNTTGQTLLPKYWTDSDSAMAKAEREGGAQFRQENAHWNVFMNLHGSSNKSTLINCDFISSHWNMYYESHSGSANQYHKMAGEHFVSTGWPRIYGTSREDRGYAIAETNDGNIIIGGSTIWAGNGTSNSWIIKTDREGHDRWFMVYHSPFHNHIRHLCQIGEGTIISARNADDDQGANKGNLLATGENGQEMYSNVIDDTGSTFVNHVRALDDTTLVFAGTHLAKGAGLSDAWLVKTNLNAQPLWDKTYGGTENDEGSGFVQTSDGGYAIVGTTSSFGSGKKDIWLIKTDISGIEEWSKTYGGIEDDEGLSIDRAANGGFIIGGTTVSKGSGKTDCWILKTDEQGNVLWDKTFGGTEDDYLKGIIRSSEGGYAAAGTTNSFGKGDEDIWFFKVNEEGELQWSDTIGEQGSDIAEALIQSTDSSYYISGSSKSYGSGDFDVILVKFSKSGILTSISSLPLLVNQLHACYPNPFNISTYIPFEIKDPGMCKISIIDLTGKEVEVLLDRHMPIGKHLVTWQGLNENKKSLQPGVYFCRFADRHGVQVNKLILLE